MKKIIVCCATAILAFVACNKSEFESIYADMTLTASIEGDKETKTVLDASTLDVKWNLGDKIKLFDVNHNSAVWAVAAIDAKGVATFTYVEGSAIADGTLLAFYPAESAIESTEASKICVNISNLQKFEKNSFGRGSAPMVASTTKSGNDVSLSFKNLFGALSFQFAAGTSTIHKVVLSSSSYLCGEGTVDVSDPANPTISFTNGSKSISVENIESKGAVKLYVPVPVNANHQFTVFASITDVNGEELQKVKDSSNEHQITRNLIRIFNEMEFSSMSDVKGEANCYMVDCVNASEIVIPLSQVMVGWNAIKSFGENEVLPEDVNSILGSGKWEIVSVENTSSTSLAYEKIQASNGVYYAWKLKTPANVGGNNAIYALKAADDCGSVHSEDILWSWHIWYTDYKPAATQANTVGGQVVKLNGKAFDTGIYSKDNPMMDRNLGATVTGVTTGSVVIPETDAEYKKFVGLKYQYGRKDPFINDSNTSDCTISYSQSVKNPQLSYYSVTGSWTSTPAESPWGPYTTEKYNSAMNPCPAGWHVSCVRYTCGTNAFAGLGDGDPSSVSSGEGADYFAVVYDAKNKCRGRLFDDGTTKVYFPGALALSMYWGRESSRIDNGMSFTYSGTKVTPYASYGRARKNLIRCVKN